MVKKRIGCRTLIMGALFTASFFLLIARTFWVQYVDSGTLLAKAQATWERSDAINPKRGDILDRNGQMLAYNGKAFTVVAQIKPLSEGKKNENYVVNPVETANKLAPLLNMPTQQIMAKLQSKDRKQVELRPGGWKIPKETADKVKALNLPGIGLYEDSRRYYPYGSFASHVLGYTNRDGIAQLGLEWAQDKQLKGQKGSFTFKTDRKGNQLPDGVESYKPAVDGNKMILTLDHQIQNYVEEALDNAASQYKVKGLTVIVADPNTGEVLGMGSRPTFDPNSPTGVDSYRNAAVSTNFEPGSTFKIVTLSAAIEEKLFNANDQYMSGVYNKIKGSKPIRDHNEGRGWGIISFKEGVKRSSNVAFVILGYEKLKKERLFDYIRRFGFGEKTGIELPGEEKGLLNFEHAYDRDVASMSFGQGVGVTAIQQVAAVGAVANGGKLMKPYIIKQIIDPRTGKAIIDNQPRVVRRVVSENTSKQVRDLLDAVVNEKDGTGQPFALPDYHVAGKTGTAQVVHNGRYVPGKYINSFIGFAPKDNPKLLVYVVVDEPDIDNPSAGGKIIAAPIFKTVMEKSLHYLKMSPDTASGKTITVEDETAAVPQAAGKSLGEGKQLARAAGLSYEVLGGGNTVLSQYPAAGEELAKGAKLYLVTSKSGVKLPDLKGRTLRDVIEIAALLDVKVAEVKGEGFVLTQSIPPGAAVKKGDKLSIELSPKSAGAPAEPGAAPK
jgi:penicillin-binding protein 2B